MVSEARDFDAMMDDAFARLAAQEACTPHDWSKPERALNRHGRMSTELYQTRCTKCGRYASRATLKRLKAEVIDA